MPIQISHFMECRVPVSGDERYWFHLLPISADASTASRPDQRLLIENPSVPIPMIFLHAWLMNFLQWIPLAEGKWKELPESRIFMNATGASIAKGIFRALADLFQSGPSIVEFPTVPIAKWVAGQRTDSHLELAFPREELVETFQELTDFVNKVETGSHLLFCSYWLDRE